MSLFPPDHALEIRTAALADHPVPHYPLHHHRAACRLAHFRITSSPLANHTFPYATYLRRVVPVAAILLVFFIYLYTPFIVHCDSVGLETALRCSYVFLYMFHLCFMYVSCTRPRNDPALLPCFWF